MTADRIWVVDDDRSVRFVLATALAEAGYDVAAFDGAQPVRDALRTRAAPDLLFTDVRMPGDSGLQLLDALKRDHPRLPVVVMSAYTDVASTAGAFRGGAHEFLSKPFDLDDAVALAARVLGDRDTDAARDRVPDSGSADAGDELIGDAPAMRELFRAIGRLAQAPVSVLVTGETGTGKELVARALHRESPRAARPFVALNTAAIPAELLESELFGHEKGAFTGAISTRAGRFELANGGTLFLDEIGDMPLELQPKLLSVLQEHQIRRLGGAGIIPVDVRIIAATNCDLPAKIADKTFRSDLYYRLNVFPITIPPLRERKEDIPLLAKFFIRKYARQMNRQITRIPEETLDMMTRLPWPGNIRELENVMERAVILTNRGTVLNLTPESLSTFTSQTLFATSRPSGAGTPAAPLPPVDKDAIIAALRETGGQIGGKSGAAAKVGLKRTTFLARLKRLGINADDFRQPEADSTDIGENI